MHARAEFFLIVARHAIPDRRGDVFCREADLQFLTVCERTSDQGQRQEKSHVHCETPKHRPDCN